MHKTYIDTNICEVNQKIKRTLFIYLFIFYFFLLKKKERLALGIELIWTHAGPDWRVHALNAQNKKKKTLRSGQFDGWMVCPKTARTFSQGVSTKYFIERVGGTRTYFESNANWAGDYSSYLFISLFYNKILHYLLPHLCVEHITQLL